MSHSKLIAPPTPKHNLWFKPTDQSIPMIKNLRYVDTMQCND